MGKENSAKQTLRDTFDFESFRPGQEETIQQLLEGNSALAVFPTGAGKSLCYQLPALLLPGLSLVVSPLIALMKDQIDFLVSKGVMAARMDSSLSAEESREVWDNLRQGKLKLLYVAPERFANERFLQRLHQLPISLMVIDEAHCISEWGHNFRPDYMKLASIARELKVERVLALTATATPAVAKDIQRNFNIADEAYVNTGFHRPNLTMGISPCSVAERDRLLLARLKSRARGATIVYVTLQKTAEEVAKTLAREGLPARAYHAGLENELRHSIQDWFMASADAVVVATIAFGMGIDKADIRYVYHYNLPKSLENYMQETGRAGRDGAPASCDLLMCPTDIATLENFSYGDTPTEEAVRDVIEHLLQKPDEFDLSIYELSSRYDLRNLVMSTLLTYLELDGILHATGSKYNEYKFQPHRSSAEMLADVSPDQKALLKRLFAQAKKGRTWFTINMENAVNTLDLPRGQLVTAMNTLEERGDITLQVAGVRKGYRFLQRPEEPAKNIAAIHQRFQQSEIRDIERLHQVVNLATESGCSVRKVLSYFGEELASDCGHCDRCTGEAIGKLPAISAIAISADEKQLISTLKAESHKALQTPRQMARFFCGLTSPATTKAKLTRDPRFGRLAHHRFAQLISAIGECS